MATYELNFDTGSVDVESSDIALLRGLLLDVNPSEIAIESSQISLDPYPSDYNLFFEPADILVFGEVLEFRQTGNSLNFSTSSIEVESSEIQLLFDPYNLKFRPSDIGITGSFISLELIKPNNPPAIRPNRRSFTPPRWSFTQLRMDDGSTVGEILCSKPAGSTVDLFFLNVDTEIGYKFKQSWDAAFGKVKAINIPKQWSQGASRALRAFMRNPGVGMVWKYAQEPRLEFSDAPGIVDVSIKIVSVLDGSRAGRNSTNVQRLPQATDPLTPVFVDADEPLNCGVEGGEEEEGGGGTDPDWVISLEPSVSALMPGASYEILITQTNSSSVFTGETYWKLDGYSFANGDRYEESMITGTKSGSFTPAGGPEVFSVSTITVDPDIAVSEVFIIIGVSYVPITGEVETSSDTVAAVIFVMNPAG